MQTQLLPLPTPLYPSTLSFPPPAGRQPRQPFRCTRIDLSSSLSSSSDGKSKLEKVVVIMGTTGCGKSKLSVDLSTAGGFETEIVNCDKIHIYKGLDVTTNKISMEEQQGIPHHLLGTFDPVNGYFGAGEFRVSAAAAISDISSRGKLPILVGCSNSFIHALLVIHYSPTSNKDFFSRSLSSSSLLLDRHVPAAQLRYDCCFIWLDASFPVLFDYLYRRIDKMLEMGMLKELNEFYSLGLGATENGLREAICVPEFERYFELKMKGGFSSKKEKDAVYDKAVREIKENTCRLAERQIGKIWRLKRSGWNLHRVDATEAIRETMRAEDVELEEEEVMALALATAGNDKGESQPLMKKIGRMRAIDKWERDVMEPSVEIVKRFLNK